MMAVEANASRLIKSRADTICDADMPLTEGGNSQRSLFHRIHPPDPRCILPILPHVHRHERHRIIAEYIDDFDGDDVAARRLVGMLCGLEF